MLDDASDRFPVLVGGVDGPLRLVCDTHVEQGDRAAPPFPVLADLRVRDGGRDVAEQEPGLFCAELEVASLAVGMYGGGLAVEPVHAPFPRVLREERLHPLEEPVAAEARVHDRLTGLPDRRVGTFDPHGQVPHDLAPGRHRDAGAHQAAFL